jgi:hypothetical protein
MTSLRAAEEPPAYICHNRSCGVSPQAVPAASRREDGSPETPDALHPASPTLSPRLVR